MEITSAGLAPFERVAESVRHAIRTQELDPGEKLPSHREMAKQHGISLATLQKALGVLQDEGWLVSRASIGVYVAANPPIDAPAVSSADLARRVVDLEGQVSALRARVDALEHDAG